MSVSEMVLFAAEIIGTVAFAFSGAMVAIAGAFVYYAFAVWCELNKTASVFIGIALVISVRLLASHYRWNLPRVSVKTDEKQ